MKLQKYVNRNSIVFLLLIVLIIFAFLLRSRMLLHQDFFYLVDQARDLLLAKDVVINHKLTLIGPRTGLGGLFHGPLWIYMITPFFFLAKGDPFMTLIPLFIIVSILPTILGFFIGWKLYNVLTGFLFGLFVSLSIPLINTVPFTTNAQVLPVIVLLYLYAIIEYLRGKEKYLILSLFAVGIGFQFESAFAVLLIPVTLFAIILSQKLPSLKILIMGAGALLSGVSTFLLFDIRHQFLMTNSALKLFTNQVKPLPGYEQYSSISFRFFDRLHGLYNALLTPLYSQDTVSKLLLFVVLFAGIVLLTKTIVAKRTVSKNDKEYLFLILTPIFIYALYILYPLPLWEHYLLPVSVIVVFLLVVSMHRLMNYVLFRIVIILLLVLQLVPAGLWLKDNYLPSQTYVQASDGSYRNQLNVAQWIVNDAKQKEYGYFVYSPGVLTYNMDYLLWWISQKNNLSDPISEKRNVTYLILYPHAAGDEGAYDYWKKNVVRTKGEVIGSKFFPGDIRVEKLTISSDEPSADPNYYQNIIFR